MFLKIFLFEIQNRVRRPAFYLYFFAVLLFTVFAFATGALPVAEKEHINSPFLIAFWCAGITMMMMLISSSVMGSAIYRDIEYQTKDYYLTYPITKPGYFWGRYLGSFVFMLIIALAILLGIYLGTIIGPLIGKTDRAQYGPNHLLYYLYPFFSIALPNLFFTSSLFFGLVAITRNVKVIYFGGILLFLFYFIALFFLNHTNNTTVIGISDPFGMNGIRYQMNNATATEQNNNLILINGPMAINRIIWPGLGLVILLFTYIRFNFEKFFSGKRDKAAIDDINTKAANKPIKIPSVSFAGKYERRVLSNLVKLELLNIIRDNYFWIIVGSGSIFLGFVFWLGERNYGIPDLPRTVMLLSIFNDAFPFFIFFIIMFYTGETLQRDRLTRYAFINDSLPPPNRVLNGSKLIPLLVIGAGLSFIPLVIGVIVQLTKGYTALHLGTYLSYIFIILLPKLLLIVVFCYLVHVIINNKFAAYAVGVTLWIGFFFLELTGMFNYHLLLYSYTPNTGISDMDGMGHMMAPISWFNLYWLLGGGILIIVAALFYYRGVSSSFKVRLRLVPERFDKKTKLFAAVLIPLFLVVGAYIYYNVSYLNNYLSKNELEDRAIIYEKALKKYQSLPLPKVTRIKMAVDIFPDKQQEFVKAQVTIINKTDKPISKMLLDADDLNYSIAINGKPVPFTNPLFYSRGFFNWFRPKHDTADFRLYQLRQPLAPGDSVILEVNSSVSHIGFTNGLYSTNLLHNGTFFTGGLPGLGYDDDDEVGSPYVRKKAGLPPKTAETEIPQNDPIGIRTLKAGKSADLLSLDVTVSTSGDQTVVTHGELIKQWKQNGRNYFHYIQDKPGMYVPFGIISARFTDSRDSIMLDHKIYIDVYHHPAHNENTARFIDAYKESLKYYSSVYGAYPFKNIRLAETSIYGPRESSTTTLDTYAEYNGWHAHFTQPNEFDYLYFATARNLAQQWWRFQVAPNNTVGSLVIPEGLANYDALIMTEKKYGKANIRAVLLDQLWYYLFVRRRLEEGEHPLIRANQWFEWSGKASVAMYGLRNLIGEDSLNNALREFKNAYAFKSQPPFAGTNDLYRYLQKHVPDSLQYYMTDTWQKVTLYDSKVNAVTATKIAGKNEYKVTIKININKVWIDSKRNDVPALKMNDYIDIGIFATDTIDKNGRNQANLLYLKKYKLTRGEHQFTIIVKGKPNAAGVDPFGTLVDRNPNDNMKTIDQTN